LFGFSAEQTARVAASKQVVYDGLKLALTKRAPREAAGILVDEQFGAAILRDARANGLITFAHRREERPGGVPVRIRRSLRRAHRRFQADLRQGAGALQPRKR
jgi:myo-inositol catabolism protein IolC